MQKSVRERTLTLPNELPCWELESWWIPECLKNDCKGQNPMARRIFYIIGNLLKCRCLKWACITHLGIWNTSYGQKKVKNRPNFLVFRWRATYRWEVLDEGYNFAIDLIVIEGLHTRLWRSKVAKVLTLVISRLPLGNLGTKSHLDVGFVEKHRVYYKGEGGGFPQVRAVVNLVSSSLLMVCPSAKSASTMH